MTSKRVFLFGMAILFCGVLMLPAAEPAKTRPANGAQLVNQMRLRQLTRSLELSEEQQKKVQALFAAEADKIAKIDESGVGLNERTQKINALKKETQQGIRPILTPAQLEKFDAQNAQSERRRKKS